MNLPRRYTVILLAGCLAIQLAGVFYYWSYFASNGYLPSPFVYDKFDTFMDFFHPLFWADDIGRYSVWGSVYPPINFLLLKLVGWFSPGDNQFIDAFALRANFSHAWAWLGAVYLVIAALALKSDLWRDFGRLEKWLLYLIVVLSAPMLFALERGNLILLSLPFLALALASSRISRIVAIGFLINIKPYFALYLFAFLVTGRVRELIGCTLVAGCIFLVSGVLLDLNFLLFFQNLFQFSQDVLFSGREMLSLPSSISAFGEVLRTYHAQGNNFFYENVDTLMIADAISLIKLLICALAFVGLGMTRRELSIQQTMAVATVIITNLGIWVGGYSFILYLMLVPVFLQMRWRWLYLATVMLIQAPLDVITVMADNIGPQNSYLSGVQQNITWQLGLGAILRPLLNFGFLGAMIVEMGLIVVERGRQNFRKRNISQSPDGSFAQA